TCAAGKLAGAAFCATRYASDVRWRPALSTDFALGICIWAAGDSSTLVYDVGDGFFGWVAWREYGTDCFAWHLHSGVRCAARRGPVYVAPYRALIYKGQYRGLVLDAEKLL